MEALLNYRILNLNILWNLKLSKKLRPQNLSNSVYIENYKLSKKFQILKIVANGISD